MRNSTDSMAIFARNEQGTGPVESGFFVSMGTVFLYSIIILTGNVVSDMMAAAHHVTSAVDSTGLIVDSGVDDQVNGPRVIVED